KLWRDQFENIFFSALHVSQGFLKQNKESSLRKILNITSYYGNIGGGNTEFFAYSVAKAALSSLTVTLAKTDGKVLVNAIAPGYTWTPPWEGISEEEKKICESRTMINRFVTADEIAHATIGILENNAITGQIITVDGGLSLQKLERK
ncbi:SDR family oxidoreductase, partial [bacterium]